MPDHPTGRRVPSCGRQLFRAIHHRRRRLTAVVKAPRRALHRGFLRLTGRNGGPTALPNRSRTSEACSRRTGEDRVIDHESLARRDASLTIAEAAGTREGGLTSVEVAARQQGGQTNERATVSSRSWLAIVRTNVLTRFTALLGGLLVVILVDGRFRIPSSASSSSSIRRSASPRSCGREGGSTGSPSSTRRGSVSCGTAPRPRWRLPTSCSTT
jgi:hypothetical protein